MITGTNHFVNYTAAIRYYREYGLSPEDVQRKADAGEIVIGRKPAINPASESLTIIDGARYAIVSD